MSATIPAPPANTHPSRIPGAMKETKRRDLTDGSVIEFESAPAGWLKKDGEMRQSDWRAYYITSPDRPCEFCAGTGRVEGKTAKGRQCSICKGSGSAQKRSRLVSVSSILDTICPKGGLPRWAEARGIEGCLEAVRLGELDPKHHDGEDAVQRVRLLKLGADRARDDAADRGLNVHEALQVYMVTGSLPPQDRYPPEHLGYYRALAEWIIHTKPEPVAVEQLVASPADGYAGRSDLVAMVGGQRIRYDAKTSERCAIYDSAHLQVRLYDRAAVASGDEPADACHVVVFGADGRHRDMPCAAEDSTIDAALAYYRALKPIVNACDSANRAARNA